LFADSLLRVVIVTYSDDNDDISEDDNDDISDTDMNALCDILGLLIEHCPINRCGELITDLTICYGQRQSMHDLLMPLFERATDRMLDSTAEIGDCLTLEHFSMVELNVQKLRLLPWTRNLYIALYGITVSDNKIVMQSWLISKVLSIMSGAEYDPRTTARPVFPEAEADPTHDQLQESDNLLNQLLFGPGSRKTFVALNGVLFSEHWTPPPEGNNQSLIETLDLTFDRNQNPEICDRLIREVTNIPSLKELELRSFTDQPVSLSGNT
jgi:hypothetical protein